MNIFVSICCGCDHMLHPYVVSDEAKSRSFRQTLRTPPDAPEISYLPSPSGHESVSSEVIIFTPASPTTYSSIHR
jgi:hypothetical protein